MKLHHSLAALSLAAACLFAAPVLAGEGHDHGAEAPAAGGPALPRFAAVSELFELVGVLNGKQLTLYLDRAADNSPVREAQIELEVAGAKYKAVKHGDDEYEVMLKDAPKPGVLAITAAVTAGTEADLLAGELDLHDEAKADATAHVHGWQEYAGWAAGGLVVLVLAVWGLRRVSASRRSTAGGVA